MQLSDVYRRAAAAAIDGLGEEPLSGKQLRGQLRHLRSLRIGVYRILYAFERRSKTVTVATIQHRSEAYRRAR